MERRRHLAREHVNRLGILGDIHEEDEFLAFAISQLQAQSVDLIVAVGDIVDGQGSANRCIQLLEAAGVEAVVGNHERWLLKNQMRGLKFATPYHVLTEASLRYLHRLPTMREYTTVRGDLLLCHGLVQDDMAGIYPNNSILSEQKPEELIAALQGWPVVINGHTHQRLVRLVGQTLLINAGTLARQDHPCFALADFQESMVTYFNADGSSEAIAMPPAPA